MAPKPKLSDADVKQIRRRVGRGEHQTKLAVEFGVNRKTIRRRLDALEYAEKEQAERVAKTRLRRQAAREKRKWLQRKQAISRSSTVADTEHTGDSSAQSLRPRTPYEAFLDRRKNLSRRALSEASGRVRLARGGDRKWVDWSETDAHFEDGWMLEDQMDQG